MEREAARAVAYSLLETVSFQRQAIERMLREATGIVNSDERLVQIRYRSRARGPAAVLSAPARDRGLMRPGWSLPAREASGSIASDNFASATAGLVDQLSSAIRTAEARGPWSCRAGGVQIASTRGINNGRARPAAAFGEAPLPVEFWRHKYEREGKTRHALEESLQALAIEQGAMEKQGPRASRARPRTDPP